MSDETTVATAETDGVVPATETVATDGVVADTVADNQNTETNVAAKKAKRSPGRPAFEADKHNIVSALRAIADSGKGPSYYITRKMINKGYVIAANMATGRPGRPSVEYTLTPKGRTYLNFSKNWK